MILKLYTTYMRPKIEFAQTIWDPYFVKGIERLEKVEGRVTKIPPTLEKNEYKWTSRYYTCDNIFQASTLRTLRDHLKKLDKEKWNGLPPETYSLSLEHKPVLVRVDKEFKEGRNNFIHYSFIVY
ncbi:unnamed protein product [Psylliodes chrysocephalus]|uniref:Uncharacterized protein n=1 Tax=Psylliodes chrysocephalus TaxID=3402493 RepID=A0A9P0GHQ9_9CUCU|nr:unnamed protein product [Psylliodes chrysocephala]